MEGHFFGEQANSLGIWVIHEPQHEMFHTQFDETVQLFLVVIGGRFIRGDAISLDGLVAGFPPVASVALVRLPC